MGKHDMPSLQFTVEGGRLVPAGPYEQEVLGSYSRGAQLTVTLHQKRSLPLLKKYWAVLRDVVDNCKTPWNSPDEASDAIKLALGVTDIGKTVKGQWFIRPGSISFNSMDQAAFRDFFDKAMSILASVTGIDPDELTSRYSHIAEQDHTTETGSGDRTAAPDEAGEPAGEAPDGPGAAGSPVDPTKLSDEDRKWLITAARMLIPSAEPRGDPDIVRNQYGILIKTQTPPSISQLAIGKAVSISKRLVAVCESTEELDLELLAGIAGCTVEEIRT